MALVFFDLETGGLNPQTHEIIEVAAIAVQRGDLRELERFERKVAFDASKAEPKALEVNGYVPADWADAISQVEFCREFGNFLGRHADLARTSARGRSYRVCQVAGYNVGFDCGFIGATFKRHGQFCPADLYRGLDVMQLALWKIPDEQVENFRLGTVAKWALGEEATGLHAAMADIEYTLRLARYFMGRPQSEWGRHG